MLHAHGNHKCPNKGKEDDNNAYHKSFKTSKVKDNKDKAKDNKDAKSYGIGYKNETPNGETPGLTPELQISKEEIIKISKERNEKLCLILVLL